MTKADSCVSESGKMVVFPSNFTGGPRYMLERTQDTMTLMRYFERPDMFIALNCNKKWQEIVQLLKKGEKPHDIRKSNQ